MRTIYASLAHYAAIALVLVVFGIPAWAQTQSPETAYHYHYFKQKIDLTLDLSCLKR